MDIRTITISIMMLTASFVSHSSQSDEERALSKQLNQAVKAVNVKVPWVLDEETRLDSAATVGNIIIYNNTMINYSAEQLDVKLLDPIIKESVIGALCGNKDLASFIDLKVVMVYRYLGKNGKFITELSKDMSSCKKT